LKPRSNPRVGTHQLFLEIAIEDQLPNDSETKTKRILETEDYSRKLLLAV